MPRLVFDWAESPGTSLKEVPRVRRTPFGDGYSQGQADGLNALAQEWDVRLTGVADGPGSEIIDFFRQHGGHTPFSWTPRWATAPILVLCPEWSRSQPDTAGESDISAKFKQTFEP